MGHDVLSDAQKAEHRKKKLASARVKLYSDKNPVVADPKLPEIDKGKHK